MAHSEKEADRSESDGHFKSPMALLLTSKDKLQAILGKHGKSESVSVNKDKEHGHQAGDHHGNSGAGRNGGEHEKAQKKDKNGDDNGHEKGDDAAGIHYNLRQRDQKGEYPIFQTAQHKKKTKKNNNNKLLKSQK